MTLTCLARRIIQTGIVRGRKHLFSRYLNNNPNDSVKCLQLRSICTSLVLEKRRKTAEERKSDRIIEFSPKKSNKIVLQGVVDAWRGMTVAELAKAADKPLELIQEAMLYVREVNEMEANTRLDDVKVIKDIVAKIGMKMRIIAAPSIEVDDSSANDRDVMPRPPAKPEEMTPRPPVVTIMGHVDHGKTTLLDTLRGAAVAAGEAGGITQHIGAFTVTINDRERVTFLDTPGHAAFSAMRARGANCTDIIVLVVAADDGVMEQTKEVVKLALDAEVPVIVAINKIDKPDADIERAKRGLMQCGVALEGSGGDVQVVGISALKGLNLDQLTEAISAQATLMDLRADHNGLVEGSVVESRTDSHRGRLSTAIVSRGTLRKGAVLVAGTAWAKVRALFDHTGQPMDEAKPGTPVEIIGWRELPLAGEQILEVETEKKASSVIRFREQRMKMSRAEADLEVIKQKEQAHLDQYRAARDARRKAGFFRSRQIGPRGKESVPDDGVPRVNVILKGDVHGSVEAILDVLDTYDGAEQCRLNVVHYGVGDVTEGDLDLATTFNAIIYAFSVKLPANQRAAASIRPFNVIYHLVDDLKAEISGKLPLVEEENIQGRANILQIFDVTEGKRKVTVLGCRCTDGLLKKAAKVKLLRGNEIIHTGCLSSMRHLKNEVDSIKKDVECGLKLEDQSVQPQPGDTLVFFTLNPVAQKTSWDPGF